MANRESNSANWGGRGLVGGKYLGFSIIETHFSGAGRSYCLNGGEKRGNWPMPRRTTNGGGGKAEDSWEGILERRGVMGSENNDAEKKGWSMGGGKG